MVPEKDVPAAVVGTIRRWCQDYAAGLEESSTGEVSQLQKSCRHNCQVFAAPRKSHSVGLTGYCVSFGRECESCQNGWTNQNAIWMQTCVGSNIPCIRWQCTLALCGKYNGLMCVAVAVQPVATVTEASSFFYFICNCFSWFFGICTPCALWLDFWFCRCIFCLLVYIVCFPTCPFFFTFS